MALGPPKGTRDFYPDECRRRNWLFGLWRDAALRFGFEEYDGPVLETEELLTRKAGEEIVDQLYTFEDKGGRRVALRPEMTPTLARMIIARGSALPKPIKWFAIPQCWRYERTQRGRGREHYQFNLDVVGVPGVQAECEVLACCVAALEGMGLSHEQVQIRYSSRRLLADLMLLAGIAPEKAGAVCLMLDKRGKVPDDVVEKMLADAGLKATQVESVLGMMRLSCLAETREKLGASPSAGLDELEALGALAEAYGIARWLTFDIGVIRGLAYYTGIVFECFDVEKKFRAVFGGGRYDNLLRNLGGEDVTAVGCGFGDMVIMEVLADLRLLPEFTRELDVMVLPFGESERKTAIEVASRLRAKGERVEIALLDRKLGKALADAARAGAGRVIIVAPDELSKGLVVERDMKTGEERKVEIASI
ncbi:MAG: histidine--tRNA ligase [Verrucomicrobia bacterium]|nr:histidine--tRNA ligase [Verrucomicrobiota bacterium]